MAARIQGVSPLPGSFIFVAGVVAFAAIFCLSDAVEGDPERLDAEDVARMNGVLSLEPAECLYRDNDGSILMGNKSLAKKWKAEPHHRDSVLSSSLGNSEHYNWLYDFSSLNIIVVNDVCLKIFDELKVMFPNTATNLQPHRNSVFLFTRGAHETSYVFIYRNLNVSNAHEETNWTAEFLIEGIQIGNPLADIKVIENVRFALCRNATESD